MNLSSLNNLENISFAGLAGNCTQDSPQGHRIPALFANDLSHITFGDTEFQYDGLTTLNFSNLYLIRLVYESLHNF